MVKKRNETHHTSTLAAILTYSLKYFLTFVLGEIKANTVSVTLAGKNERHSIYTFGDICI